MDGAVATDLGDEPFRERVDDGDADAVEASRDLVALAAELAAGVELRQNDGEGGEALVGHDVDRDARAPVRDGDGVVRMKPDLDPVVPARERLVDRVVHDLVDEVVEAPRAGRADVHPGPQPDRLEALEDGDVLAGVGGVCHVPLKRKIPAKQGFCGFGEVYQTTRSARAAARLATAARRTASRSSGSSIGSLTDAAHRSSSGSGAGNAYGGRSTAPGDGTGPGANRSGGGPRPEVLGEPRADVVLHPAELERPGGGDARDVERAVARDALRPGRAGDRVPDRRRPDPRHLREDAGVGDTRAAQGAPHRAVEALHQASRTCRGSRRGAARAPAAAPRRPSR